MGQVYAQRGGDVAWARRTIDVVIDSLRNEYDILMPTLEALGEALPGFSGSEPGQGGLMDDLFRGVDG